MAMVIVMTRPKGAKPVKFFTIFVRSHWIPALLKKFWAVTIWWVAGFSRCTPISVKRAPNRAVRTKSRQKRIAGGGSLLQTR